VVVNNVSGNKWFDFVYDNKIILSINPQGQNLGNVTVDVGNQGASNAVGSTVYLGRGIDITSTAPPTTNYKLRLFYLDAEMQAYAQNISNNTITPNSFNVAWRSGGGSGCNIANYSGGQAGVVPNTRLAEGEFGIADNGFYLQMTLNHFTVFAATSNNNPFPLPVKLLSFTGHAKDKTNVLEWRTATEQNNKGFAIERSHDGSSYEQISFVNGAGNTNTVQSYSFTDYLPSFGGAGGSCYYRLKQVDFDGKFDYSNVIAIANSKANEGISIYPNPSSGIFTVVGLDPQQTIQVSNALGQMVAAPIINQQLDLRNQPKGIYFLQITATQTVYKIVKE
jgi:hypothetical protein